MHTSPYGVVTVAPQDTFLNLDANNYSTNPILATYTWPDYKKANAIVMKTAWPGSGVLAVSEDQKPFALSSTALTALKEDGLSESVAAKLEPLVGQGFATEREMTAQLKSLLTADELTRVLELSGDMEISGG